MEWSDIWSELLDPATLIPLVLFCFLPVLIVIVIFVKGIYGDKKRADILTKAAEYGANVDLEKMAELLQSRGGRGGKDSIEILNRRLMWGTIFSLVGLVLIVVPLILMSDYEFFVILGSVIAAIGGGLLIVYFTTRTQIIEEWRRNENRSTEDKK